MNRAELYPGFDLACPAILAPIEPGIGPLCDALNALAGVHTLWSCEGHADVPARPYVTFIADNETAFKVHLAVGPDHEKLGLKFNWGVDANFRQDGSLQFTIQPNDYRIGQGTWHRWWSANRWNQRHMNADLMRLAALVATIKYPRLI